LSVELEQRIVAVRRQTSYGPVRLAGLCPHPPSTIGKVLRRYGCSRLPRQPGEPRCVQRYERDRPGELLHVDTKKLGRFWTAGKRVYRDDLHRNRGAGWQALHVAVDDHSRLMYAEVLPSERAVDCAAFLRRAVAAFADQGVRVERVLSDNAKAYHGILWRDSCASLDIQRRYIRPTGPAPTERPNARSRPSYANGPMHAPTRQASNAPALSEATSAGTTADDRTARSGTGPRPAASHTYVVTTPSTRTPPELSLVLAQNAIPRSEQRQNNSGLDGGVGVAKERHPLPLLTPALSPAHKPEWDIGARLKL